MPQAMVRKVKHGRGSPQSFVACTFLGGGEGLVRVGRRYTIEMDAGPLNAIGIGKSWVYDSYDILQWGQGRDVATALPESWRRK